MVNKTCSHCGIIFFIRKADENRGRGRFCSLKCSYLGRAKGPVVVFKGEHYSITPKGYFVNSATKSFLHRAIWRDSRGGIPDGFVIHHKDGNSLNNNLDNLEMMEDAQHKRKHYIERKYGGDFTSFVKGVYWNKRDRLWYAKLDGQYIGCFKTENEARTATLKEGDKDE